MQCLSRLAPLAAFALCACAGVPTQTNATALAPLAAPLVTSGGLVIGTLSYQYVDVADRTDDGRWIVHLERVDGAAAAAQDYALAVDVDRENRSGVFSGTLPEGVYAFRAAESADRHYAVGAMKMPFEVQAGEVRDAGHFALSPLSR